MNFNLEKYSYNYLLNDALSRVPDKFDKREGSVIFDAIAPACYELSGFYLELDALLKETYALTATGIYLDYRAAERGIVRKRATYSVRHGSFTNKNGNGVQVAIGTRFAAAKQSENENSAEYIFYVTGPFIDDNGMHLSGEYLLECETAGTEGDIYMGDLIPITPVSGIAKAVLGRTIVSARDDETDDELRERYLASIRQRAFGGNIYSYKEAIMEIEGVGGVQIYPCWQGGGTVKCSIIAINTEADLNILVKKVQDIICPNILASDIPEEEIITADAGGYGIAPIGAMVTICAPEIYKVNVEADIKLKCPFNSDINARINNALGDYFADIKKDWDTPVETDIYKTKFINNIYISKINSAILNVAEIINVANIKINGAESDIILENSSDRQYLPVVGEVIVNVTN